jgi:hypothetical protein
VPAPELSSLLPISDIQQHWQQQQQQVAAPAAAARPGDPLPCAAVTSWLSSGPGLRVLSEALKPGTLLEYRRDGVWVPVLVVSCSLAYSRQPEGLQAVLAAGFAAAAAGAGAVEPAGSVVELPPWQAPGPKARVATVMLLAPGGEVSWQSGGSLRSVIDRWLVQGTLTAQHHSL